MWSNPKIMHRPVRTYTDFVANSSLNALATYCAEQDCYFIGIHSGLVVRLGYLFHSLFATMPTFGDIAAGDNATVNVDSILRGTLEEARSASCYSSDGSRRGLAGTCQMLSVEYILFHELAHILCGHLDRCRNVSGDMTLALGETEDVGEVGVTLAERQAMELDADQVAAMWLFHVVENNTVPLDKQLHVSLMAFSLAVATHCLPGLGRSLGDYVSHDHPHNEVRFNGMYSAIHQNIPPNRQEYPSQQIFTGVEEAIKVCQAVFPESAFPECFAKDNTNRRVLHSLRELNAQIEQHYTDWAQHRIII